MEGDLNQLDLTELQKYHRKIALEVILVLLTCGLYDLFWQYRQMEFVSSRGVF